MRRTDGEDAILGRPGCGRASSAATAREIFADTTRIAPGIFAGVLGDNGGLTRTVALRFDRDNPAIGGANPETATPTDQRGVAGTPIPTSVRSRRRGARG